MKIPGELSFRPNLVCVVDLFLLDCCKTSCNESVIFSLLQQVKGEKFKSKHSTLSAGTRAFQGFILAVADCLIADILEPILLSAETPFLRVDFLPCSPAVPGGYTTERLELYRLNVSVPLNKEFGLLL